MPKKIIVNEAFFNITKAYIEQRKSRILTSLNTMEEESNNFIELLNKEYGDQYPTYCKRVADALRELEQYVWQMVEQAMK